MQHLQACHGRSSAAEATSCEQCCLCGEHDNKTTIRTTKATRRWAQEGGALGADDAARAACAEEGGRRVWACTPGSHQHAEGTLQAHRPHLEPVKLMCGAQQQVIASATPWSVGFHRSTLQSFQRNLAHSLRSENTSSKSRSTVMVMLMVSAESLHTISST